MEIHRLKKGDNLIEELEKFVADKPSGLIIGLGALEQAELKLYLLEEKEYSQKQIEGPLEIGSFVGVVGKLPDGKMGIHPHAVLSNKNFETFSGHISKGTVGATFEFCFFASSNEVERYFDEQIGLNLIK